ncbi:hypothetical protein COM23_28585 [Bacillus wiedmannii]|uniref:hypothetical protein n=1 Tax=Bacillus cereus group TaxID=86661 RepID=UPI000BF37E84|nr:hypothetical protein [Bacillus wiedmannii]PGC18043.1 hypothetical protein COM23_28585 [Bacillus wiedmannii]
MINNTALFEALLSCLPEGNVSGILVTVMVVASFGLSVFYTYMEIQEKREAVKEKRLKNMLLEQQVQQSLQLSSTSTITATIPEANNSISNNNN